MNMRQILLFVLVIAAAGLSPVLESDASAQTTVRWDKTASKDFLKNQLKNDKVQTAVKE